MVTLGCILFGSCKLLTMLFCSFKLIKSFDESTTKAPGVGLEPTSPRGHQLSFVI